MKQIALLRLLLFAAVVAFPVTCRAEWGLPPGASAHAGEIDSIFRMILWITASILVLVEVLLVLFIVRYRRRRGMKARYLAGSHKLEILWTVIPVIIVLFIGITSQLTWASLRSPAGIPSDALSIEVLSEQFAWNIRYPGPDQQFGRTDPRLISDENPWGLDEDDPAGEDDIVTLNEMHVPVNRPIRLVLKSKDVIHSFFLPEMRFKQDAVPGMRVETTLTPTRSGEYEIVCAEFCGMGHYRMRGFLTVGSEEEFQEWLDEKAEEW